MRRNLFTIGPAALLSLAVLTAAMTGSAAASVVWDESSDGDLSSDPENPTPVEFSFGSNVVSGTVTSSTGDTRDYITFSVPAGLALSELRQLLDVNLPGGGTANRAFHAIIEGDTSFVPDGGNIGNFLGSNHFDPLPVGTDMLPDLADAVTGGTGFEIPLGPGTYTYHVQQTGSQTNGYSLDFVLVPEPASALLLASGFVALLMAAGWGRRG